jgi:hypothetical protein
VEVGPAGLDSYFLKLSESKFNFGRVEFGTRLVSDHAGSASLQI